MAAHLTKGGSCDSALPRVDSDDRDSTRGWLEVILEDYHNDKLSEHLPTIEIEDYRISPLTNTAAEESELVNSSVENSLMEILSIWVKYKVCGCRATLDMVAKVSPHDPMTRAFVKEWALDKREIKFYTEVLPALESLCPGLPIPICYHASYKEESDSVLVLEDLCIRDFQMASLTRGLTLAQSSAALRSLAKIHAASLAYIKRNKADLRRKYPYLLSSSQACASFQSLARKGLPLLIKFLQNKPDHTGIRERLQLYQTQTDKIEAVIEAAFKPSLKLNTLVHCDFWINNLLFKKNEDGKEFCFVIDWQTVTVGSPAIDLALLFTTSLVADVRRDYRKTLLTTYWTELRQHLTELGCQELLNNCDVLDIEEDMKKTEAMAGLVMVGSVDLALGIPEREKRVLDVLADYFQANIL